MQLVLIMALAVVLVPVALFTTGAFRVVLGIIFVSFFPGYTMLAALFPRKDRLSGTERVALSFVLSVALVALMALAFNYSPWGIRINTILSAIAIFSIVASLIAFYRQRGIPEYQRTDFSVRISLPRWKGKSGLDKVLMIGLLGALISGIGLVSYTLSSPRAEEEFTEFYFAGQGDYHQEVSFGEEVTAVVGIINHEGRIVDYCIIVEIDEEEVQHTVPITLDCEEEWEGSVSFVPVNTGEDQKVEFFLLMDDDSEPCLTLDFRVDVKLPES